MDSGDIFERIGNSSGLAGVCKALNSLIAAASAIHLVVPAALGALLPETSDVAAAATLAAGFVLLLLPIQVHPPGGKQGLTAALGCLAWAGVRRVICRPPDKSPERRALINNR